MKRIIGAVAAGVAIGVVLYRLTNKNRHEYIQMEQEQPPYGPLEEDWNNFEEVLQEEMKDEQETLMPSDLMEPEAEETVE